MSLIQQKNDKIICQCGSTINNESLNICQHRKTLKHKNYMSKVAPPLPASLPEEIITEIVTENNYLGENKITQMTDNAKRVQVFRAKQRELLGEDVYKEKMNKERKASRIAKKAKDDAKKIQNGEVVNPSRQESKQTKADVASYVSELIGDLDTHKKYDKPAIIQMVKQKLKKFDNTQGAVTNCEELVSNLDKNSLVNAKYGEIKLKSLNDYMRNIKLVYKYMTGKEFDCNNFEFSRDIATVKKAIEEMPRERKSKSGKTDTEQATKTKRFTAFASILERLDGFHNETLEYKKLQDASQKVVDKNRGANKMSTRETDNWMTWGEVLQFRDDNWDDEDRLLYSLYTCMPPRRLEYGKLLLARHKSLPDAQKLDRKYNYIVTNKNNNPTYIILNSYKTDFKYGEYIVDLNKTMLFRQGKWEDISNNYLFNLPEIAKNSKALIMAENMIHLDPFFVNTKGNLYINKKDESSFGRRVNEVFRQTGKLISVNILRHSFISNFLSKSSFKTLTDNTLAEVSSSLGHSASMFYTYRKIDNPEERVNLFVKEDKN